MTSDESGDKTGTTTDAEHDVYFPPVVTLPEVSVPTLEEDEVEILKIRAKLYRLDRSDSEPEWKDRGAGELKMLKHPKNKTVRIVMRRDKTLKVCANHFVTPLMDLKPKVDQDKAFIYTSPADFSHEEVRSECFAIKFGTVEIAKQFEKAFVEAQAYVKKECKLYNGSALTDDEDDDENEEDLEDEHYFTYDSDSDSNDDDKEETEKIEKAENSKVTTTTTTQNKNNKDDVKDVENKLKNLEVNGTKTDDDH